ncbi:MAG: tetratricopeptide repeat protein, partial [Deltaproteobacteria bacterium]|nr:tetratricopeptide repeat protein [Deltaproteobacteria bacterium]
WSPLLDLLRDGERLLFTEEERKACHLEIAAILAERLGDDAGAIPWLESAFLLDEADRDVSARLEEAYTRHGRWADLASLLRSRLALLPREERGATAFQLAQMLKDRLEDLGAAVELLEGLLEASDTNRDAAVAALEDILSCTHAGDYETAAPRAASRIAPILEAAGEWERLVRVLRAQAAVAEDPAEQARHCMDLAAILEDRLEQASEAFDATAEALRRTPERREVVEALQQRAILADREDDLVALLREAIGDPATAPSPWAPGVLADILQSRGEEPETVAALLERLVELEPSAIGYHRRLADTYELLGQPDDRIRVLEGMIPHVEDVEEQADALLLLGELLLERGRTAEAADVLRRLTGRVAGHLTDRDRRAFTRLEEILEGEENWFDLEGLVRRRAALAEDDREKIEALYRAAALQEEHLDNPDAAIQGYRLIGELDPREGPAAESLERLFRATGRFEDLAELYRARLERDDGPPRGAQDMFRLARVLVDPLARPEEALAQLVRLLEREPGH